MPLEDPHKPFVTREVEIFMDFHRQPATSSDCVFSKRIPFIKHW